ncbi:phosphatase PAP2 family protein [Nannocystaceae bacterium ST9]
MSARVPLREAFGRALRILIPALAIVIGLGMFLPAVALDGPVARGAVWVADSGSAAVVPWVALILLAIVVTRPGLPLRTRGLEAVVLLGLLLLALGGMSWANEHLIKPAMAIPRPNIVELADQGVLGLSPDEFYALGDKPDRSAYLAERLAEPSAPPLAAEVREHWLVETGYSFPSGHSLAAMTFSAFFLTLALSYLDRRRRRLVFLILPIWALAVIASRPLLRVHSALDIGVGACEGVVIGLLSVMLARWLIERATATNEDHSPVGGASSGSVR